MKRAALAAAAAMALAAVARAQLVPLARCQAAYPCNMPYGLLPADAAANLPDARLGNSLIGVAVNGAFKPRLAVSPVSPDFADDAARLYVLKHPLAPTPRAAAAKPMLPPDSRPESP
jgi:hypothetical protein